MSNPYATNSILKSLAHKRDEQGSGRSYLSQETRTVRMVQPKTVVPDSPDKSSKSRGSSFMNMLKQRASSIPATLPSRSLATARTRSVPLTDTKSMSSTNPKPQPSGLKEDEVSFVPPPPPVPLPPPQQSYKGPKSFSCSLSSQSAPFASSSWRERASYAIASSSILQSPPTANVASTSSMQSSHATPNTKKSSPCQDKSYDAPPSHVEPVSTSYNTPVPSTNTSYPTNAPSTSVTKPPKQRGKKQDENYVRLNMKSRGSYRTRQNASKKMRRLEKYKSRRFGRYAEDCTDANEEEKPRLRAGTGLSGYGLDALQLSLDALQTPITPLPCTGATRPQRRGKYRSSGPVISADDTTLEELAPMCAQHGMKCKLLIVKKSGGNKVLV